MAILLYLKKENTRGDELNLRAAIDLFGMKSRIKLFVGDALETIPKFHKNNPESKCSFAYLDFDLYEPTKTALNHLNDSISIGGVIVFDEAENLNGQVKL